MEELIKTRMDPTIGGNVASGEIEIFIYVEDERLETAYEIGVEQIQLALERVNVQTSMDPEYWVQP